MLEARKGTHIVTTRPSASHEIPLNSQQARGIELIPDARIAQSVFAGCLFSSLSREFIFRGKILMDRWTRYSEEEEEEVVQQNE